MELRYFSDSDSLHIDLRQKPAKETVEVTEECYVDVDEDGHPCAILLEYVSTYIDRSCFNVNMEGLFKSAAGHTTTTVIDLSQHDGNMFDSKANPITGGHVTFTLANQ